MKLISTYRRFAVIGANQPSVPTEQLLELDCAYGETGKDSLRSVGVSRMPEAMKALAAGKVPRKAGLIFDYCGSQYHFTLQAETFAVSGLKLPEVKDADTPRTLLEEQITQLRDFTAAIDGLYGVFLAHREGNWPAVREGIRFWIENGGK